MQDYKTEYQRWLNSSAIDEKTRAELLSVKDNEKEQEDRFYTELEFGTAGLRGILGAGTNRMNVYVVRRATAGLAAVISKISPALAARGVAIAYDSRRCSKEFAYEAARTLAVCGIRSFVFSSIHSVPQLSFAVRELWCAAGIVITASHNPPQYNGYKVYWSHGGQVGPELAEKIFESIRRADYFDIDTSSLASVNESQMICTVSDLVDEAYYKKALSLRLNPELMQERGANFRVVYTPLHGAGLVPVTEILKRAGLKKLRVVEEQAQPDGDFPTVAAPNPEDPNAFTLALQLAKKTDAQLLLATDPDSDRKTYAEDADAEIVPGADQALTQQGDGGKTPEHDANGGTTGAKDATTGELTATETVPADQAENTGADESGQTAETALLYYQTLLEDRLSGLFECQRFYIYWETAEDYHTVHKSSDEHQIISNAGAYDVSAKLQNDALIVDDGWIQRKDPGVIVKVVERSVLGSGVQSTRQAETVCGALKAREGWSGLDAVRNGRVILLSEELLSSQVRRTGAAVLLAKAMYPSLFSDTDAEEALRALTQEAYGAPASGTFIYVG